MELLPRSANKINENSRESEDVTWRASHIWGGNGALPERETALMTAAWSGSVTPVKVLIAHGADVNARERWKGQTALTWAAVENHREG